MIKVVYTTTEEGEPWAVYAIGAHDPLVVTREAMIAAMNEWGTGDGDDWAAENPEGKAPTPEVFYLSNVDPKGGLGRRPKGGDDDDAPLDDGATFYFCDAGDPGAFPVTGLKLG